MGALIPLLFWASLIGVILIYGLSWWLLLAVPLVLYMAAFHSWFIIAAALFAIVLFDWSWWSLVYAIVLITVSQVLTAILCFSMD